MSATAAKKSFWKVNLPCFISFNLWNAGEFEVDLKLILRPVSIFGKRKKIVVLCSHPTQHEVSCCSHATTLKKSTKKNDKHAKLLFCKSKPMPFLPFSLLSLSSFLKLSINIPQTCLAAMLNALGTGFCSACLGCSRSLLLPDSLGWDARLSLLLEMLRCFVTGVKLARDVRWSFLSSVSSVIAFGASSSTYNCFICAWTSA